MPMRIPSATFSTLAIGLALTGAVPALALADTCFSMPSFSAPSPMASYPTERQTAPKPRHLHHVAARHHSNAAASLAPARIRPAASDDDMTMPPPPQR